mgnify:CR=1 FL=1
MFKAVGLEELVRCKKKYYSFFIFNPFKPASVSIVFSFLTFRFPKTIHLSFHALTDFKFLFSNRIRKSQAIRQITIPIEKNVNISSELTDSIFTRLFILIALMMDNKTLLTNE